MRLDIEMISQITPKMVAETKREMTARHNTKEGSALKDIKNAVCGVCGKNSMCYVDDLTIRVGDTDVPNLSGLRCDVCGDYAFGGESSRIITEMERHENVPAIRGMADVYWAVLNEDRGYGDHDD